MTEDRPQTGPDDAARPEEGLLPADPERDDVPAADRGSPWPRAAVVITGVLTVLLVAAAVLVFGAYAMNWFQT